MGVIDVHSHILYGVDDGAGRLEETGQMLQEAKKAGVSLIIATPHLYATDANVAGMQRVYSRVCEAFSDYGIELRRGFECNYRVLLDEKAETLLSYRIQGTDVLLLEPPRQYLPESWEPSINALQRLGIEIVIAHPERCLAVQEDISVAERMLEIGCELQVSAGSLYESMFSKTRKCALEMLKEGYISYIASDAHCVADYKVYAKALKQYGHMVQPDGLLKKLQTRQGERA